MAETQHPPAGWYDDPEMVNTRRYWNGTAWTEHRQEKAAETATPQESNGSSFWRSPLTFGGAIIVLLLAAYFLVGPGRDLWETKTSVDGSAMAADINAGLKDQGMKGAKVTCDDLDRVEQGDVTICEGTNAAGEDVSVKVTFNSDGSYVWQQQ